MAQYSITYSCGHTGTVNLIGPHRGRDRKIKWFEETGLCPECWAEKVAADKAEQLRKITALNSGAGLPALTGTERQVAWAEKIRYNTIKNVPEWVAHFSSFTTPQPFHEDLTSFVGGNWPTENELAAAITKFMSGHSEASWWIDHVADNGKRRCIDGIENGMAESFIYEFLIKSGFKNVFLDWQLRRLYRYMQYELNDCWVPPKPDFITGKWNGKIYRDNTIYIDGTPKKLSNDEYEIVRNYTEKSDKQSKITGRAEFLFDITKTPKGFHEWVKNNYNQQYRNRLLKINNIFGEDAE